MKHVNNNVVAVSLHNIVCDRQRLEEEKNKKVLNSFKLYQRVAIQCVFDQSAPASLAEMKETLI